MQLLTWLEIEDFPNLRYLSSRGFRNLNSLASLRISDCPEITSLLKDGLHPSLLLLIIRQCPQLEEHCERNKGLELFKIAHIPHVKIGHGIYSWSRRRVEMTFKATFQHMRFGAELRCANLESLKIWCMLIFQLFGFHCICFLSFIHLTFHPWI